MKSLKIGLGLLVAVLMFLFVPLPYYITYPGEATSIERFMTVEDGEKEPGELMMVTISQRRATPLARRELVHTVHRSEPIEPLFI